MLSRTALIVVFVSFLFVFVSFVLVSVFSSSDFWLFCCLISVCFLLLLFALLTRSLRCSQNKQSNAQLNVRKINFPNNFTANPSARHAATAQRSCPSAGPLMHLSPAAGNALPTPTFFSFLLLFLFFVFVNCSFLVALVLPCQRRQISSGAKSIAESLQCVVPKCKRSAR